MNLQARLPTVSVLHSMTSAAVRRHWAASSHSVHSKVIYRCCRIQISDTIGCAHYTDINQFCWPPLRFPLADDFSRRAWTLSSFFVQTRSRAIYRCCRIRMFRETS